MAFLLLVNNVFLAVSFQKAKHLRWVWSHDLDRDGLLCGNEIPLVLDSVVYAAARKRASRGCIRHNQLDIAWHLGSQADLQRLEAASLRDYSPIAYNRLDPIYSFESVPDHKRTSQWPYAGAEGLESMATWVWHGPLAKVSTSWTAASVEANDSIVVRGQSGHAEFWLNRWPSIETKLRSTGGTVRIISQGENVPYLPGKFASMANSPFISGWWIMNLDRPSTLKLHPMPIGHVWKTDVASLQTLPRPASRDVLLLAAFSLNRPERKALNEQLRGFPRTVRTVGHRLSSAEYWSLLTRSQFVVSPWGEGPDCHRTWEALAAGAIPIVRAHPGLTDLFAGEPVVVVDDWSELTPSLLAAVNVSKRTLTSKLRTWVSRIMPQLL